MTSGDITELLEPSAVPSFHRNVANLIALGVIQVANALLPLVAYPLMLRAIGIGTFSRVVVTESVMFVVLALVIYSFDVEGVATVVGLRALHQRQSLAVVFSEILTTRVVLVGFAIVGVLLSAPFVDRTTLLMLLGWMLFPLSYALQSTWFFQGMERNVFAATVIAVSRLMSLALLYALVRSPTQGVWIPFIIGGSYSVGGLVLLAYIAIRYDFAIAVAPMTRVRGNLLRGKEIFLGNLSVALYRGSNVLILNAFSTARAVALYSIAEKTVKVFQAGAGPLNQVFFPKVIQSLAGVREPSRSAARRVLRYTLPQLGLLALGALVVAGGYAVFGQHLPAPFHTSDGLRIVTLVTIMSGTVFFGVTNYMFGTGGLNYLGRRAYFAACILTTGALNVIACSLLVRFMGEMGAAICFVSAEALLLALVLRSYLWPASRGVAVTRGPHG